MMGYGGLMGFGGLWMIVPLLFWVGVIAVVVWGASSLFPHQRGTAQDSALNVLKERYARGEITAAEYQQARQDLAR